jgi:hypothetical protein
MQILERKMADLDSLPEEERLALLADVRANKIEKRLAEV